MYFWLRHISRKLQLKKSNFLSLNQVGLWCRTWSIYLSLYRYRHPLSTIVSHVLFLSVSFCMTQYPFITSKNLARSGATIASISPYHNTTMTQLHRLTALCTTCCERWRLYPSAGEILRYYEKHVSYSGRTTNFPTLRFSFPPPRAYSCVFGHHWTVCIHWFCPGFRSATKVITMTVMRYDQCLTWWNGINQYLCD